MQNKKRVFKTKKLLSGGVNLFRAWKDWDEEDTFIGKFIGSSPNRKSKLKKDWIFEPIEVFFSDKKEQKRIAAGPRVLLNSAGQLDKGMAQVEEGAIVQIVYNGSAEMEGGEYAGQMAHSMEVTEVAEVDDTEEEDLEVEEDEEDDL